MHVLHKIFMWSNGDSEFRLCLAKIIVFSTTIEMSTPSTPVEMAIITLFEWNHLMSDQHSIAAVSIKSQFEKLQGISFWKFLSVAKRKFLSASSYRQTASIRIGWWTLWECWILSPGITFNGWKKSPHDTNSKEINHWDRMKQWKPIKFRSFPTMQLNANDTSLYGQLIHD